VPTVLKSGSLSLLEHSGPVQACNGITLLFIYLYIYLFKYRLEINQESESFEVSNPVKTENKLAGKYISCYPHTAWSGTCKGKNEKNKIK